jgi:hypothetical protein
MSGAVSRYAVALALAGACVLAIAPARADKTADAEDLFRRAKALVSTGKHAEACPMFEESQRLDPQMGTLLNLALCHEAIGKNASAWGEFRAVEQQARLTGRDGDRASLARDHANKLEPKLSRIKLLVPADARVPGLVIKVDGESKAEVLWPGVPADPGTRLIEVSAPGKKSATVSAKVNDDGAVVQVVIPKLDDLPKPVTPPPPPPRVGPDAAQEEEYAANRSRKTTGYVIGGIGLAALAVGGGFGIGAILNDKSAKDACPQPCFTGSDSAKAADQSTDRAFVFANIANVMLPLGVIGTGIAGYLLFTAGPTEAPARGAAQRRVAVTPILGGVSGLGVSGRW